MENQQTDVYQVVSDKIIKLLEAGIIPWRKSWTDRGLPRNLLTRRPYRGVNLMLLNALDYEENHFLTFDQVKAVGGSVKKNEKSQMIIYWKWVDSKPIVRYANVFNISQCRGIPSHYVLPIHKEDDPIRACERIVEQMQNKPTIEHWENRAFYNSEYDIVNVPEMEYFVEIEAYYATLFFELMHSTGSENRLNRKELADLSKFGATPYATEILIAEIGTGYLQSFAGINHNEIGDRDAYIQGWIGKFRHDKKCIIYASSMAQKAAEYILNLNVDMVEETEPSTQLQPATA